MATAIKHKQRSARSYRSEHAGFNRFKAISYYKNERKQGQKKSIKKSVSGFFKRIFKRGDKKA